MKVPGILIGGWVAAAGAALTLSGCSGSSPEPEPKPGPSSEEACPTAEDLAAEMSDPRVTQIKVLGDCQSISISTALTQEHANLALLVCDAAGRLAYPDSAITGVTVLGETGDQLATGVRNQPCAAIKA
jgi:hypothetical protein